MGEIVKLRQARKRRERRMDEEKACENRARFGRARNERQATQAERRRADAVLDASRLEKDEARQRRCGPSEPP